METNHIAVLVRSIEAVTRDLPSFCVRHPQEDQPAEGTTEQYIEFGPRNSPWLLLVQAVGEGPYLSALQKRGPGLHHLGCTAADLDEAVRRGAKHRLLLHPVSLALYPRGLVWLCRPEVPFLIELMTRRPEEPTQLPARLQLPREARVPEYVRTISSNLTLSNREDSRLALQCGDRCLIIDAGAE